MTKKWMKVSLLALLDQKKSDALFYGLVKLTCSW